MRCRLVSRPQRPVSLLPGRSSREPRLSGRVHLAQRALSSECGKRSLCLDVAQRSALMPANWPSGAEWPAHIERRIHFPPGVPECAAQVIKPTRCSLLLLNIDVCIDRGRRRPSANPEWGRRHFAVRRAALISHAIPNDWPRRSVCESSARMAVAIDYLIRHMSEG